MMFCGVFCGCFYMLYLYYLCNHPYFMNEVFMYLIVCLLLYICFSMDLVPYCKPTVSDRKEKENEKTKEKKKETLCTRTFN